MNPDAVSTIPPTSAAANAERDSLSQQVDSLSRQVQGLIGEAQALEKTDERRVAGPLSNSLHVSTRADRR